MHTIVAGVYSVQTRHNVDCVSETVHVREFVTKYRRYVRWDSPSPAARSRHEPGRAGTRQRLPPELHWHSGTGRKEPIAKDAVQSGRRADDFTVRYIEAR
jgi:hypothetical protein